MLIMNRQNAEYILPRKKQRHQNTNKDDQLSFIEADFSGERKKASKKPQNKGTIAPIKLTSYMDSKRRRRRRRKM